MGFVLYAYAFDIMQNEQLLTGTYLSFPGKRLLTTCNIYFLQRTRKTTACLMALVHKSYFVIIIKVYIIALTTSE